MIIDLDKYLKKISKLSIIDLEIEQDSLDIEREELINKIHDIELKRDFVRDKLQDRREEQITDEK